MISSKLDMRVLFFVLGFGTMWLIEGLHASRQWRTSRTRRLRAHALLAAANTVIFRIAVAGPFLLWANFVSTKGWGLAPWLGLKGMNEIISTIVLFDFLDYWKHRWFHRVRIGWNFHQIHHTDTHLDLTTGLRYHAGELFLSALIKAAWIALWGPSLVAFAAFEVVLNLASQFHHSNIDLGDAWDSLVGKILVTPRYHAIHHSVGRLRGDTNFSTLFSFWDRLGGTREEPSLAKIDFSRMGESEATILSLRSLWLRPFRGFASSDEVSKTDTREAYSLVMERRARLIDVREINELKDGLAELAEWIPTSAISAQSPRWLEFLQTADPAQSHFVYCAAGVRSGRVVRTLRKKGLHATNLGGFEDLQRAGLPVRPPAPRELQG